MEWIVRISYRAADQHISIESNRPGQTKSVIDGTVEFLLGSPADESRIPLRKSYVVVIKEMAAANFEVISDAGNKSFTLGILLRAAEHSEDRSEKAKNRSSCLVLKNVPTQNIR